MAILLSFILAVLVVEAVVLKGRNRILAVVGIILMGVTLWWLPKGEQDLVLQSERVIRLMNHPEQREAHLHELTSIEQLMQFVDQTTEHLICVPTGARIQADGLGVVTYQVYISTDSQVVRRSAKFIFRMKYNGEWTWINLILGDITEIDGDPYQEKDFRVAMSEWYNR